MVNVLKDINTFVEYTTKLLSLSKINFIKKYLLENKIIKLANRICYETKYTDLLIAIILFRNANIDKLKDIDIGGLGFSKINTNNIIVIGYELENYNIKGEIAYSTNNDLLTIRKIEGNDVNKSNIYVINDKVKIPNKIKEVLEYAMDESRSILNDYLYEIAEVLCKEVGE